MSIHVFLIVASLFLAIFPNIPLYINVQHSQTISNPWIFTIQLITMIFGIYLFLLTLISFLKVPVKLLKNPPKCSFKLLKITFILSILFSGISFYLTYFYQIVIDKQTLINFVETNPKEAIEFFSLKMCLYFLSVVLFPLYFFIRYFCISINNYKKNENKLYQFFFRTRFFHIILAFSFIGFHFIFSYQSFASNFRNNRALLYQIAPLNVFYGIPNFIYNHYFKTDLPIKNVNISVNKYMELLNQSQHKKPPLFLWLVGETARSDFFSLNGHPLLTNPELTKIKDELLNLQHDTSCDTYTKGSIPCLFSPFNRKDFKSRHFNYVALPQQLKKAGFQTVWIDNQSGCKGVCDDILTFNINHLKISELKKIVLHSSKKLENICRIPTGFKDDDTLEKFNGDQEFGECGDKIMLLFLNYLMDTKIIDQTKPTIVFFHQMGSHGPSYYKRVPNYFKYQKIAQKQWFLPTCNEDDLTKCDTLKIQNSYRNTVLYTDFVISKSIDWLKNKQDKFQTALLYHSDHGESLGENGIYLHGLPYTFAPDSQKEVPIIWWFSSNFKETFKLNSKCLSEINNHENVQLKDKKHEDDHLFHSFLGLLHLESIVYNKNQDIFTPCKS